MVVQLIAKLAQECVFFVAVCNNCQYLQQQKFSSLLAVIVVMILGHFDVLTYSSTEFLVSCANCSAVIQGLEIKLTA
jgi:hypothetical protein